MKSNFVVLCWLIKRRLRKASERRTLRNWYKNRDILGNERHASHVILAIGLVILLIIVVATWPFVLIIQHGKFLFGY